MRQLIMPLPAYLSMEEIDGLRQREHSCVSRKDHCDCGDEDEQRLDVAEHGLGGRCGGEERHPEVDENEVLAELGEDAE